MKKCFECYFIEKDDSSLFCSNCGKLLNSVRINYKVPSQQESPDRITNKHIKERILLTLLTISGISTFFLFLFHSELPYFLFTGVTFVLVFFSYINLKFSYEFEKNKNMDTFTDDLTKLGTIMGRHQ